MWIISSTVTPPLSLLFCLRPVFGKMDQMLSAWVIFSSYSPLEVLLLFSRFIVELWIFFTKCKDDSFPFLNDNFLWCTSGLFSCFEKKFEYLHICKELCWYETMTCHMQSEPTSLRKKHVWMSSYSGKDLFCLKDNAACKLDPSFSSKKCNCILCQLCILCMHVLYIVAKSFLFARQRWTFIQKATPPPPPFARLCGRSWKRGVHCKVLKTWQNIEYSNWFVFSSWEIATAKTNMCIVHTNPCQQLFWKINIVSCSHLTSCETSKAGSDEMIW